MKKTFRIILGIAFAIMLFYVTNVYAEETETTNETQYTITIDPNGGIEGKDFKSTIVLSEGESYPVNGMNENFLKAPEGKRFAGIELINKDGEVEGLADSVLLWGYDFCEDMTLKFYWGTAVSDININLEYPNVGDSTTTPTDEYGTYDIEQQTNKPTVTVNSDYDIDILLTEWVDKDSFEEEYGYYEEPFIGTFENGKKYYALVELHNKNNKDFAFSDSDSLNIKLNGKDAKVYKVISYSTSVSITLEVEIGYPVIEGAEQKVVDGEKAEFEIDADYSLFKEGGEVYVDNDPNPLVSGRDYTSKAGSTIITLTKDYISTLSEGEHSLKVVFNDDNTTTTSFTVTKNTSDTENDIDNTETNTDSIPKNEITPPPTGVHNPETGDNILLYISMLVLSIIGFNGTILISRKRFN